jgi:drug/metabolite transporter (DMT)-like permease
MRSGILGPRPWCAEPESSLNRAVWILLAGTAGISFAPIFVRYAAPAPPVVIAFYRVLFAALLMSAWFALRGRAVFRNTPGRNFALLAGVFFGSDMALWHSSLVRTSVATSTLLVNTTPIYVGLYALAVLGERLERRFVVGAGLALTGTVVLVGMPADVTETTTGALLALAAAVFYAAYLLAVAAARRSGDAISTVFVATLSATATLGLYALLGGDAFSGFPPQAWIMMGAAALVSQIGGVLGIVWALRFVPATFASVALLAQPVLAAAWGALLLGEAVRPAQAVGGCAVLAGIALASRTARVVNSTQSGVASVNR